MVRHVDSSIYWTVNSLTEYDKDAFKSLLLPDMKESVLCSSLRILSELLEKHHGQKVILLIDEYDVPLAKAFELGLLQFR